MYIMFFSARTQHLETVSLQPTDSGWFMQHPSCKGETEPCGRPVLFRCLKDNHAEYPPALEDALEELWEASREKQLSQVEIQNRLNVFSNWILNYEATHQPMLVH